MRTLPREARRRIAMSRTRRSADDVTVALTSRTPNMVWLGIAELGGAVLSADEALNIAAQLSAAARGDDSGL